MKRIVFLVFGLLALAITITPALAQPNRVLVPNLPSAAPLSGGEKALIIQNGNLLLSPVGAAVQATSAPTSPALYSTWWDTSSSPSIFKVWDGAQWLPFASMDRTGHVYALPGITLSGSIQLTGSLNGGSLAGVTISCSANTCTSIPGAAVTGQIPNAAVPPPTLSALGGAKALSPVSHQFLTGLNTDGTWAQAQPAFGDISGSVNCTQLPALTGDVTTSAGACPATIASNAVTNAKSAQMAAGTIKGNPTGSTANPSDNSVSSYLDAAFGSTQGSVLYRGASSWSALGAGSSGQYLSSQGASANPQWASSPAATGHNLLINGGLWLDQRNVGTAQTLSIGAVHYTVDRWYALTAGASPTGQQIAGTSPYQYAYQITGAAGNTSTAWGQRILSSNACAAKNQTLAFQVQVGASLLTSVTWTAYYANSADNWSAHTQIATGTFTINSTPTIKSTTFNAGANACNGIEIVLSTGALTSGTIQYGGLQLEIASQANNFENVDYGANLQRCLFYAEVSRPNSVIINYIGFGYASVGGRLEIGWPVSAKRIQPTGSFVGNVAYLQWQMNNAAGTASSVSGVSGGIGMMDIEVNFSGGGSQGQGGSLNWYTSGIFTTYLLADAELY